MTKVTPEATIRHHTEVPLEAPEAATIRHLLEELLEGDPTTRIRTRTETVMRGMTRKITGIGTTINKVPTTTTGDVVRGAQTISWSNS